MDTRYKDNVLENMTTTFVVNKLKNAVDMLDFYTYDKQLIMCLKSLKMVNRCTTILNQRNEQNDFFE